MIVKADRMARDVRTAIDMNRQDDPLFTEGDTDTLTLDQIILSKLADAVRTVELEAPLQMLESGHDFVCCGQPCGIGHPDDSDSGDSESGRDHDCAVFIDEEGRGMVTLPTDFMRLIAFRMSDWERTVHHAITEMDPEYAWQSSRFRGLRGNPQRPVCAIVRRSEGKVLEFYSCRDNTATVTQATYIPIPRIDRDGGIDVAMDCYRAAVYRAAYLTLASVGDPLATPMLEMSHNLLSNQP